MSDKDVWASGVGIGGRLAMAIPSGILDNPALGRVRTRMPADTRILAVVDMVRALGYEEV